MMEEADNNMQKSGENRELPLGMGYKTCWMVVEGTSQKVVMDAFLQGRKMKYTYQKGLEKLAKAPAKENKLLVTATYKKQNYVIGTEVSQFFYETEEFLAKCKDLPRVYVYMTDRVSETHGFALVENGQLVRLFSYDENEIKNIGEPLPEEIELGYHLPKSFEDVWDKEGKFTEVNEDMLIELATCQVGIDVEKYPYKDVRVGKRFEYSSELADDPYPDGEFEISEETWNLPEVQRFQAAGTTQERLEIANELKDVLTHPIINAFGEIMDVVPSYGRLSQRCDELFCIIRTRIGIEEGKMDKEELLEELNSNHCVIEGKSFYKGVVLDNIECEKLIFKDCKFFGVQFVNNRIGYIEFNDCHFDQGCVFKGKLQNTVIRISKGLFYDCKIEDFELLGDDVRSEITDTHFWYCTFSNIHIQADLIMQGGYIHDCTGDKLKCVMNKITEVKVEFSKFENININADIIKNSFREVRIHNLQNIDRGKEPVCMENTFKDCDINNELRNQ